MLITNGSRKEFAYELEGFMSRLPSDVLLQDATTQELLNEFFKQRESAVLFGKLLKARFGGGGGNIAWEVKEQGYISQVEYELLQVLVDYLDSTFTLIQSGWHFIKHDLDKLAESIGETFPKSETDYFLALLQENWDIRFRECVQGQTFKRDAFEKTTKAARAFYWSLDSNSLATLKSQVSRDASGIRLFYFEFAFHTAVRHCCDDETLKDKLKILINNLAKLSDLVLKACRDERKPNPPKQIISYKWENGERYTRTQGGWKLL
ncbi:MAG TPA: hypothetical protein VE956_07270 [Nodularia sp. (in: cyanobacteria)]|nr:hypothetical protein [Nodularia sp. (in: cyanobacteria)]